MNENNIDHSMESWEEDQFNNAGGRRRRSFSEFDVEERRVIVRARGFMEGPQMRFSVLVPLVRGDFLHKQRSLAPFFILKYCKMIRNTIK